MASQVMRITLKAYDHELVDSRIVTTSFFVGRGTGPLTCDPFFFTVSMIFCADESTNFDHKPSE